MTIERYSSDFRSIDIDYDRGIKETPLIKSKTALSRFTYEASFLDQTVTTALNKTTVNNETIIKSPLMLDIPIERVGVTLNRYRFQVEPMKFN